MRILEIGATIMMAIFLAWMVLSWVDVINHNGPGQDGEPANWNAFVIMTEVME